MTHAAAREQVARAAWRLARDGLVVGTSGNVSVRSGPGGWAASGGDIGPDGRTGPDRREFAVTPMGAALAELRAEQVAIVDRCGRLLDGPLPATSELYLHLALYERRDAGAVVHTHSPMATALACVDGLAEVPVVHYNMAELGGSLRVAPYHTFGTVELAEAVLAALEDRSAALMANHGAVCFAADLATAVQLSLLTEWACAVYWRAAAVGVPRTLDALALERAREALERRAHEAAGAGGGGTVDGDRAGGGATGAPGG